ncbi:D-arabinono-1,4-lactone oxidase [Microbulbifer sp. CnH-101-G]|uniref:D-arabinono-1,4-lactone oxidase n=1 Tax=Microbulbifer sp. CnH-101-G TaxID=3243393 RepID=UPI004039C851
MYHQLLSGRCHLLRRATSFLCAAGLFFAAGASAEQLPPPIDVPEVIKNYQETQECFPGVIHDPSTIAEVQAIVRDAAAQGRKVMTGTRRFNSQIDAACAGNGEVQITLENMDQVVSLDKENRLVTVQAGMRFNNLAAYLREHELSVPMVTELAIFSIGGMLGSGTHGSTFTQKSNMISDYVTEIKLVDGKGDLRVINGELLNAARVNLGVLGVVVEVTIEAEPGYKVRAKVKGHRDDSDLENVVLDLARDNHSANIAWFPGLGRYTVTTYNKVPLDTRGNAYNAQADVSDFSEYLFGLIFDSLHEADSAALQCFAASLRYTARSSSYFRDVNTGLKKLIKPTGHADLMQHFVCKEPNNCVWDKLPIALQEVAIPFEELPNWIADVRQIIAHSERTCFPLNGIYFRFGKASDSYLGMSAGRDTAFVGIEYTLRQRGEAVPKNYFVNLEIEQMSLRKYGARPHWGKNSVAIFEDMPSRFPKWSQFLDAKAELDPENVFTNPFWERVSGQDPLENYLTPHCNADGQCYCRTDEHCEQGASCQAGSWYSEARICKKD